MFELFYPGNCFGNLDISAKECKKCKIKQYCTNVVPIEINESGVSRFRELVFQNFTCKVESSEGKTEVKCFDKDTNAPCMDVEFSENGKITVHKGETHETVSHIVSKEKAELLFNKMTGIEQGV